MAVSFASMKDVEIKAAGADGLSRLGTNVNLEINSHPGGIGDQVIVRVWVKFDASRHSLHDVQQDVATKVHQVLQEAAASSKDDLAARLANSVDYNPDR